MPEYSLSDFDFVLPQELVALSPARPRDSARLLDASVTPPRDLVFSDLPDLLRSGDLLVANDARVIPSRLGGFRGSRRLDLLLVRDRGGGVWSAMVRPARLLRDGDDIRAGERDGPFSATVRGRDGNGLVLLDFRSDEAVRACLGRYGRIPLPPYIARRRAGTDSDIRDYQTVFAAREGAVAAPTAGLHFTTRLTGRLGERGIRFRKATLYVGPGTFVPVRGEAVGDHVMIPEYGEISPGLVAEIRETRLAGGRVIAVGTTMARLLESAAGPDGQVRPLAGETDLFIRPGYRFRVVDMLLTNFHLPRSTLFMLVAAAVGLGEIHRLYAHAISGCYRFYSYGDACLLPCHGGGAGGAVPP